MSLADSDRVELRSVVAKRLARTDPVTAFLVEKERVAPGAILVLTRVDGEPELRVLSLEVPIDEPAPPIEWDYEVEVEG